MNKTTLFTAGKKFTDVSEKLYVVSLYDLEPSGILIQAYNQESSKEYLLSISEQELSKSYLTRSKGDLSYLLDTLYLGPYGNDFALQSSLETIKNQKKRPTGEEVEEVIKKADPGSESIHDILCTGLVELCKVKPSGLDAVKWLGEWLLANNPSKPCVDLPEDE